MISQKTKEQLEQEKKVAARAAVAWVKSGMRLGLGSGSTSHHFIRLLGERLGSERLKLEAIASSKESEALARAVGIAVIAPQRGLRLDLTVDGADEVGPDLSLIKGGGGALLREKVVARASNYFLVIADSSKRVERLGAFPLPVEVIPFTLPWVMDELEQVGGRPVQRMNPASAGSPYLTDQQNYIVDCHFGAIESADSLATRLDRIPGIAEHGLFLEYARAVLIAEGSEVTVLRPGHPPKPILDFQSLP